MTLRTTKWDVSDNLKSEAAIKEYLEAVIEDGDPALIVAAMGDVARARGGMTKLAKSTGLRRELLYQSFSKKGNPQATTLFKVMKALRIRLTVDSPVVRRSRRTVHKPVSRPAAQRRA
jgi:probable addiction module antidote protein